MAFYEDVAILYDTKTRENQLKRFNNQWINSKGKKKCSEDLL